MSFDLILNGTDSHRLWKRRIVGTCFGGDIDIHEVITRTELADGPHRESRLRANKPMFRSTGVAGGKSAQNGITEKTFVQYDKRARRNVVPELPRERLLTRALAATRAKGRNGVAQQRSTDTADRRMLAA